MPHDVLDAARTMAASLGTTPNDALVLLARRGMLLYAQELEMARHAQRQWAAIAESTGDVEADGPYLPFEDARAAAMSLREG